MTFRSPIFASFRVSRSRATRRRSRSSAIRKQRPRPAGRDAWYTNGAGRQRAGEAAERANAGRAEVRVGRAGDNADRSAEQEAARVGLGADEEVGRAVRQVHGGREGKRRVARRQRVLGRPAYLRA